MHRTLSETHRDDVEGGDAPDRVEPALYVVLEGERPLAGGMRISLAGVREVQLARGRERAWSIDGAGVATLTIPDPRMSGRHARLVAADGVFRVEDLGSTNGTFVSGTRTTSATIDEPTVVTLGAAGFLVSPAEPWSDGAASLLDAPSLRTRPRGVATLVPAVDHPHPRLVRVAMSKLSILLLGESGAGKEVLARSIHELSARSGPFVAINCGALAPSLVEGQLFGHVRGAFSGAVRDEPGLVRASSGGTLFLDEIGELPAAAQATLLRVLQEHEVLPVGGTKPVPVDLRVVAATLKPIEDEETFRPDLYARIAAFVHRLPALRERRADLGLLVAALLPRIAAERAPDLRLAPDLVTALLRHEWPRNVRELEHVLSVAVVTAPGDLLRLEHVGEALSRARGARPSLAARPPAAPPPAARKIGEEDARLRDELVAELERTHGNVSEVARTMGRTRMQIHRWMKRFGISPESFRG